MIFIMKRRTREDRNKIIYELHKLGLKYKQIAKVLEVEGQELHEVYIGDIIRKMRKENHE
jgi:hypothetical protein